MNFFTFRSEKSRNLISLLFWGWEHILLKKIKGKWSEISEVRIAVSNTSDFVFVNTWSIREAEWGVQRVGFMINCKNPYENSKSIYSVTWLTRLYLRASRLKSPTIITWVLLHEKSLSRLENISKNWSNCCEEESVGWLTEGRYTLPITTFLLLLIQTSAKIDSKTLSINMLFSVRILNLRLFLK